MAAPAIQSTELHERHERACHERACLFPNPVKLTAAATTATATARTTTRRAPRQDKGRSGKRDHASVDIITVVTAGRKGPLRGAQGVWHHPPQFPTGRQLSPQHSGSGGRGAVRQDASHVHGSGTVLNPPRRRLHVWRSPQLAATRSGGRQLGRQRQRLTGAVGQACRRPWWMAAPPPPPAAAWAAQPKRILAVIAATVATAVAAVQIAAAATPAPAPEAEVAAATTAPPQLQTAALTFNDAQLLAATPPALSPSTWCWRRSKSGQRPAPPPPFACVALPPDVGCRDGSIRGGPRHPGPHGAA